MAAPKNNRNAARAKDWRDTLVFVLENYKGCEKGMALREIANTLIAKAIDGDMQAIKEIGDRIDGKAVQCIEAEINRIRDVKELTDEELESIAAGVSTGTAGSEGCEKEPDSVH